MNWCPCCVSMLIVVEILVMVFQGDSISNVAGGGGSCDRFTLSFGSARDIS